jgi:hypothetical protein
MSVRRLPRAAILCALAAGLVLSGCSSGREGGAGREGLPEDIGHLVYNVYITRELNLRDAEDSGYFQGTEAGRGFTYYGVFLQVCNDASNGPSYAAASDFKIIDTNGDVFRPIQLPPTNIWAYHPRALKHKTCIPRAGSLPASGPTGGALLLFKFPIAALENRPFDLYIQSPPDPASGKVETKKIELDI